MQTKKKTNIEPEVEKIDGDLEVEVNENPTSETAPSEPQESAAANEQLDKEEAEFRAIRRDLDGVKGTSGAGIVAISVGKTPTKNEFFRTHKGFRPRVPIVDLESGMERQYFAVTADMIEPLASIGITVTDHILYLTVTARGAFRIVPVRQALGDAEQNEYHRTKEMGLIQGMEEWVRFYTDEENHCYRVYPAPVGRFSEPQFPNLAHSKIFALGFTDKGRRLDSTEHAVFKKWAGRDTD
jgi:hypothetical protein